MKSDGLHIDDRWILSLRGKKNDIDPLKPYGWIVEKERTRSGLIEDTGIIFLTNRECPFHCLMCDLWKNTTDKSAEPGNIPAQIKYALEQMPGDIRNIKLYNSGSFFDNKAIPKEDYREIAGLLAGMKTVIVESHPFFIGENCLEFDEMLIPELDVAIGLETVCPDVTSILNKRMTAEDFSVSVKFLRANAINARAFILLKPPLLDENEGIYWAEESLRYAFGCGVECCTIIPVRAGNGAMEELQDKGLFTPPDIKSLERVLEYGIGLKAGRVFADTWDLKLFSRCHKCFDQRIARINNMNLYQSLYPETGCDCN